MRGTEPGCVKVCLGATGARAPPAPARLACACLPQLTCDTVYAPSPYAAAKPPTCVPAADPIEGPEGDEADDASRGPASDELSRLDAAATGCTASLAKLRADIPCRDCRLAPQTVPRFDESQRVPKLRAEGSPRDDNAGCTAGSRPCDTAWECVWKNRQAR
jgi:hypothetical protein